MNTNPYMTTYTGLRFYPFHPRREDVRIEDIAHHLALTCRWSGAVREFYSVAQHSVLVAERARDIAFVNDGPATWATSYPRSSGTCARFGRRMTRRLP